MRQVSHRDSQILGVTVQHLVAWTTQHPGFVPSCEITDSVEDTTSEGTVEEMFTKGSVVSRISPDIINCLTIAGKFTVLVPLDCRNIIFIHYVIPDPHYSILTARLHTG
jgi:hypothetical protein